MKKRIILLCLVLCLLLPAMAQAAALQPDHAASLTLRVTDEGTGLPGVRFDVYRVAAFNEHGRFQLLEGFAAPGVDINHVEGAEAWSALAKVLAAQAKTPTAAKATDPEGKAAFTGLKIGLYLAVGYPIEYGSSAYDFAPFLVSVPGKNGEVWVYHVQADVKHTESGLVRELHIIKNWQDGNRLNKRPEQIKVGLFCDGVLYATAVLNAQNGWMMSYHDLAAAHVWTVEELEVPSGYSVTYTQADDAYVIINTLEDKPGGGSGTNENIPQTGLLWWPVPVLAVLGLALVALGLVMRRKWSCEHE